MASTSIGPRPNSRPPLNDLHRRRIVKVLADKGANLSTESDSLPNECQGYIAGELCRQRGARPSAYEQVGMDEYARGFRAAYYKRQAIGRADHDRESAVAETHLAVISREHGSRDAGADLIDLWPNPT